MHGAKSKWQEPTSTLAFPPWFAPDLEAATEIVHQWIADTTGQGPPAAEPRPATPPHKGRKEEADESMDG